MSNLEDLLLRKEPPVVKEVERFCVSYYVSLDSLYVEATCRCHAPSPALKNEFSIASKIKGLSSSIHR